MIYKQDLGKKKVFYHPAYHIIAANSPLYTQNGMTKICILIGLLALSRGIDSRKIVDLTHTLSKDAPKWPLPGILENEKYFQKRDLHWGPSGHIWVAISYMEYYEHMGTHIDAPIHTAQGRPTVEQIPVEKLIGSGVVFNIKEKAAKDPDYGLTVSDIEEYESEFGRVPDDAIVVINSGWAVKFPKPDLVFGSATHNDSSTFHFPGYTIEAAQFLLTKRRVRIVGTDAPSVDLGNSRTFEVHVYLQSHDVPLMEYVANLDSIPQNGTTIFLGAPKFQGGTGGPTRALAVIDDGENMSGSETLIRNMNVRLMFLSIIGVFYLM